MDIDADHTLLQSLKTYLSSATLQDTYLLGRQFLNGGRDSRHWAAIHALSPSSRVDGCGAEAIDAQNSREFIRLLTMYDRQVRPVTSLVFAMIVAYCFPAFWLAGTYAIPRAHPSTLLRASLRRTVPSFTVEVRRRPRLAASPRDEVLSLESKVRPTAFERDFLRITAATFEPKTSNPLAGVGAASHPTRRILESLVPDKLPGDRLQDESSSEGTANPKSRARRQPSERAAQVLRASSDLTLELAGNPSVASVQPASSLPGDAVAVSPSMPTATANRVVGEPGGPPPRPEAKARVRMPIAPDASWADASAKDQLFIPRTEPLVALPTSVEDASPPNRKRTILGRYVFGDELKPGERWRQRSRKGR